MQRLLHHRDEWKSRERDIVERLQIQIVLSFIFHISVSWFIHRVGNERSRASPRLKDALLNFVKFKSLLSCHPEVLSLSREQINELS